MKEKKDIFNGKIKEEYFSYILVYMIFFVVLFLGVGIFVICGTVWGAAANPLHERILLIAVGAVICLLSPVYLFLELLVIRQYPKYAKLRGYLFNSDIYFTDSISTEYRGRRRNKAAFDLVTAVTEQNRKSKNIKFPLKYKVYNALIYAMAFLEIVSFAAMCFLAENEDVRPPFLQKDMTLALIGLGGMLLSCGLMIFFFLRAYAIKEETLRGWQYPLCTALIRIAVQKNNRKRKFWYQTAQLDEIENLIQSAAEKVVLKLERKGDKLVSFTVVNTLNDRVVFTGLFI